MQFNELVQLAIHNAGKQETLAIVLDLAPSALSKRINGEVGWTEKEIDKLFAYTTHKIADTSESDGKVKTLKDALKIIMEDK